MYGALGSLGVALVRSDAAGIFATGKSWFQCPPVVQVNLLGTLPPGVRGKDVIVALCGLFPLDVLNHSVEFMGSEETMTSISMDDRLTISNMSTEWSATSAIVWHLLELQSAFSMGPSNWSSYSFRWMRY